MFNIIRGAPHGRGKSPRADVPGSSAHPKPADAEWVAPAPSAAAVSLGFTAGRLAMAALRSLARSEPSCFGRFMVYVSSSSIPTELFTRVLPAGSWICRR